MIYLLPYLAAALLLAAALVAFACDGRKEQLAAKVCEALAALTILVAIASIVSVIFIGAGTSPTFGYAGFGFSARIDALSVVMMSLVSFVGWVVLRYVRNYLSGEARQGTFLGWMCLTIAAVLLLVSSGNLVQLMIAWSCTSLFFHKLLLFYPERFQARRAARKEFLTARSSDYALLVAVILLGWSFGTGDVAQILSAVTLGENSGLVLWATGFIAVAAILKSAQFPSHGWLTEVMETPTPVSALLHAGLINAGGFLLTRFADVMLLNSGVMAALVGIGGFTALFGCVVMLTQPAVKTSLAWSTISQMGFMIFQCGLALFPIALLHIVAHSLYKAHAFLSAGDAVENVTQISRPGPIAPPSLKAVSSAFLVALGIYMVIGVITGLQEKSPQAIALGGILIFGVTYLLAQGFADAAPKALTKKIAIYASLSSISYFILHSGAELLMAGLLPAPPTPGPLEWTLITLSLISFGSVAFAQSMFPLWVGHPAARDIRVHLSNGLYAKALFDRFVGAWSPKNTFRKLEE